MTINFIQDAFNDREITPLLFFFFFKRNFLHNQLEINYKISASNLDAQIT